MQMFEDIPVSPEGTDMESESAGMQCKAQTTAIPSGIARICNAAVRQADQSSIGIFRWNGYKAVWISALSYMRVRVGKTGFFKSLVAFVAGAYLVCLSAHAGFLLEVQGAGQKRWPITINTFRGEVAPDSSLSKIIEADLERSGVFRAVPSSVQSTLDENSQLDTVTWKALGSEYVVMGSVTRQAADRLSVQMRLWDVVHAQDMGGQSYQVTSHEMRMAAHRMADFIYQKITGEPGAFSTRIAYVSQEGSQYRLWVADADGESAQAALTSSEPIISPAWSPNGASLAYVSFEARKPVVYTHQIATGQRRLLSNFKGSNSSPSWSPDGSALLLTLTLQQSPQIYRISAVGGTPVALTQGKAINTEATYGPDGRVYFVSDRGGSPQIYRMSTQGDQVERVTFEGDYNTSPAVSPDGRWLAYISRSDGGYHLKLMDLTTKQIQGLTQTKFDEHPSFAPNSRAIVYTTRQEGQDVLMTTTLDGSVKTRLRATHGDVREPVWGPFLR